MKIALITACIGHIICGITDCMLAFTPEGRFDMSRDTKDPERMKKLFARMPLRQIELSMLIGVFALFMAGFGFVGLSLWAAQFSQAAGTVMYISGMFFIIPIAAHHVLCGAVEWFYIRLGRTEEARKIILEFFKKTSATMYIYLIGVLIFSVAFLIAVVTGQTNLPQWSCIFNVLPLFLILSPFRIAGTGNLAGAVMFLGLFLLV